MKQITCVIMDWAGTAVDYGCFAPLNAFLKVFAEEKGIDITYRQAREPMGLLKIDHIKAILSMPEVAAKSRPNTIVNGIWKMYNPCIKVSRSICLPLYRTLPLRFHM